jgi:Secretory lipase
VLFYHSDFDEIAPIAKMRQLAARYCHNGVQVHQVNSSLGQHSVYALTGSVTAMDYLGARFRGQPAPDDC